MPCGLQLANLVVMFARPICLHIGEKQLREQECDKTPDWKLEIPIGEFTGVKRNTHTSLSWCDCTKNSGL